MIRYKSINGTQTITEICESCGEKVRDLHISDVAVKSKQFDWTVTIKDSGGSDKTVKTKTETNRDNEAEWVRKKLLDAGNAPKYGVRPESLCSESIDTITGVTSSFCYRTTHPRFLAKYSSSFYHVNEIVTNITGSKMGMDRNGKIVRMRSSKDIDINTGVAKADSTIVYKGPDNTAWWRALNASQRATWIPQAQACTTLKATFGPQAVDDMSVVKEFRDIVAWDAYMNRNCR